MHAGPAGDLLVRIFVCHENSKDGAQQLGAPAQNSVVNYIAAVAVHIKFVALDPPLDGSGPYFVLIGR